MCRCRSDFDATGSAAAGHANLRELFERLEFKSWLRELEGERQDAALTRADEGRRIRPDPSHRRTGSSPSPTPSAAHYETILTKPQLDAWLDKILRRADWYASTPKPPASTR